MAALSDWQLERFCQARAVEGKPNKCAPGRTHDTALSYAAGIIGNTGNTKKAHIAQKIEANRAAVVARLQELGGPADDLFKGV